MLRELFEGTDKKMRFLPKQKPLKCGGEGGIRTHVPVKANAFRVRPVMTTSILLPMYLTARTKGANLWEHPLGTDKIEYIKF